MVPFYFERGFLWRQRDIASVLALWWSSLFLIWPMTTLESILIMHVVTLRARSLRKPKMIALCSAMLFVHLSESSAKRRRVMYLHLSPMGDVMIVAAQAPV
jgi:hypothetical protein